MSTINSGENYTLENKQINSKESGYNEQQEKKVIGVGNEQEKNNDSQDNNNSQIYYKLFIYSDSGTCIYHKNYNDDKNNNNESIDEESENEGIDKELGAIQGIIQAVYFTPLDIDCEIHMISTDIGLLSYKAFTYEKNILLLALIFPNFYSDETLSHRISKLLLEYIYNFLLMNIGKKSLFKFGNSNEIEKLRRIIDIYSFGIHYILNNHSSLTFLLKAEKKLQVDKDVIYGIKHYIDDFIKSIKKDIFCLTVDNNIVCASSNWLNIHIIDRILFILLSKIFSSGDIMEIPIYFTKTQLEDEGIGISPYKLIIINLMKNTKLLIVSDNNLDLENLDFRKLLDDFFISKFIQMQRINKFGNDILDTYLKGAVIHNKFLKTYKIMGDENLEEVYQNFLINNIFTNFLFDNEGECLSDQFYIKDNHYFTFYYYKINALCFLLLLDKETTFEDINAVTSTLKALKDSFDNRENYKDYKD